MNHRLAFKPKSMSLFEEERQQQRQNLEKIIERKKERIDAYTWCKHRINEELKRLIDQRNLAQEDLDTL